jgi:hypothetical protein
MPAFAMRLLPVLIASVSSQQVFADSYRLHVRRVYASPIPAKMVNLHPFWNMSNEMQVCPSVSRMGFGGME